MTSDRSNTSRLDRILSVLDAMADRYLKEFLGAENWDIDRLRVEWFYALRFLLSRLYFQGRNDALSDRYHSAMRSCLVDFFGHNPTARLEALWADHHIPRDNEWTDFDRAASPLWNLLDDTMGKRRDREMVLDVLRYVHGVDHYNVVNRSLDELRAGRLKEHRRELMSIWSVGKKTSAFYLRDLVFLYDCDIDASDFLVIQPMDTWVVQVVNTLRQYEAVPERTGAAEASEWLVARAADRYNPARLNVGAWYLGKHAFRLILALLADQDVSSRTLVSLKLGDEDGS